VGQIILRKGWDVWLDAAVTVVRKNPRAHFVLVGQRHSEKRETRELEQQLRNAGQQPPLNGHLHWLGNREKMETLLPEFAALAHAARQEPFGRVLLEAAACGVPVVATDVGGTREIFGDASPAADLIPVDDASSLAAGILDILNKPDWARGRAAEASQRVIQRFDHRRAARMLLSHYEAVLA
jgi:glycosyltransferase involved in cell wall biosynthesis